MFYITLIIFIATAAFDLWLSILNYKHRNAPIPDNVSDVYDTESYNKWLAYTMENFKVDLYAKVINFLILLAFMVFQIFPKLSELSQSLSSHPVIEPIVYMALYGAIYYLISLVFDVYKTFHIEEKYGFNQTNLKTFVLDQIKSLVIIGVLGFGFLFLVISLYNSYGNVAMVVAWAAFMCVMLVINLLYGTVFIKWFNKLTPLEEGPLLTKLTQLANSLGYEINQVSIMDASKRSSKLNAFFTGFGRFKSIVLYDTLVEKCDDDEIVSVLAHEIGHARHKDTLKNILSTAIHMGLYMFLLTFFLSNPMFSEAFGFAAPHIGFGIIVFSIFVDPISTLIGILDAHLSRKAEFRADACATDSGYGEAIIRALKVLSRENFSNLTPHPLLVTMTYSHPPVAHRITAIESHLKQL